jgi:hypothetical protein
VARAPVKSTLADWTATGDDDDVNGFYAGEKRQRGGRKRRKKNKEEQVAMQDWDDIYDPTRPNNYEEYKHSEEKIREVREWKDRLYAHRKARKPISDEDSEEESYRPQMGSKYLIVWLALGNADKLQTSLRRLPLTRSHLHRWVPQSQNPLEAQTRTTPIHTVLCLLQFKYRRRLPQKIKSHQTLRRH